jgi:hypothetical protein
VDLRIANGSEVSSENLVKPKSSHVEVRLSGPQLLDGSEAILENLVKPELMTWATACWRQWSCHVDDNSPLCAVMTTVYVDGDGWSH